MSSGLPLFVRYLCYVVSKLLEVVFLLLGECLCAWEDEVLHRCLRELLVDLLLEVFEFLLYFLVGGDLAGGGYRETVRVFPWNIKNAPWL